MAVPTVSVTVLLFNQNGTPIVGGIVKAKLSVLEVYQDQHIDPVVQSGTTDANGSVVLALFPNALGTQNSFYTFDAFDVAGKRVFRKTAVVPNTNVNLDDIAGITPEQTTDMLAGFPDGKVAAPSVFFKNDRDTGFYRPEPGVIAVVINGAEVTRFMEGGVLDSAAKAYVDAAIALLAGSAGAASIGNVYTAAGAVALNLRDYIDDDGFYNVLGFVPQNLKAAIRAYTSTTDVSSYAQSALSAAISDGHGVRFPRGRYVSPGLAVTGYLGTGLRIDGVGALIRLGANETGLTITDSERVYLGRGLRFDSTAISGANQIGVLVVNSSELEILGEYLAITYGIRVSSSKMGIATQPSTVSMPSKYSPIARACQTGFWCTDIGEYAELVSAMIFNCTGAGARIGAGNTAVQGGRFNGNDVGIEVTGTESSNGDHGGIVGAVMNHNAKAGMYLHDFDYSFLVSACQIWANVYTNFGAGPLATSFGVYAKAVKNLNLSGNVIARNKVNFGVDGMTTSQVARNTFIAASDTTTANILEITALTPANGNIMAPNTFEGSLLAGANNNDYEQIHTVGAAGEPAFLNSWVNLGSGFTSAAFRRTADGWVHSMGVVASGGVNSDIYVLPAGYRPAEKLTQAVLSNGAIGQLTIGTDGTVHMTAGSNVYFSLDSISWKAAA